MLLPLAELLNFAPSPNAACATEIGGDSEGDDYSEARLVCQTLQAMQVGEELTTRYSKSSLSNQDCELRVCES